MRDLQCVSRGSQLARSSNEEVKEDGALRSTEDCCRIEEKTGGSPVHAALSLRHSCKVAFDPKLFRRLEARLLLVNADV
jgi:hypothetical protein